MRALIFLLSFLFVSPTLAEGYPERNIRMIVPYPAGGATDILARTILQPLSEALGKPVIIDNKSGAGGILGGSRSRNAGWIHDRIRQSRAECTECKSLQEARLRSHP